MAFWGINTKAEKLEHDINNLIRFLEQFKSWVEKESKQEDKKNLFVIVYKNNAGIKVKDALKALSAALRASHDMMRKDTGLLKSEVYILKKGKKASGQWIRTELQSDYVVMEELKKEFEILIGYYEELKDHIIRDLHDFEEEHSNEQVRKKSRFLIKLEDVFYAILKREHKDIIEGGKELEILRKELDTPRF